MARKHKHLKRNRTAQPVERTLVRTALVERRVREVPEGTPNSLPIAQDDGSTKFFVVERVTVRPAIYRQGKAQGQTIALASKPNVPPSKKKAA